MRSRWESRRESRWNETAEAELPAPAWEEDVVSPGTPLRLSAVVRANRRVGHRVRHKKFGPGVVVSAEEAGDDLKYTVRFGTQLVKVMGRFLTAEDGHGS